MRSVGAGEIQSSVEIPGTKLRVMEASRGSVEAAALSPEQAALYQRYVWASGRA